MDSILNATGNMFGASPDSIVVKEIVSIISSAMSGTSLRDCYKNALGKIWKIALLLGIPILMKNTDKLGVMLARLAYIIFYRKMEIKLSADNSQFILSKKLEPYLPANANEEKHVNGVPIYAHKTTTVMIVEYCPIFHSSFIEDKKREAEEEFEKNAKSTIVKINCIDTKRDPRELYGSKNFLKAASIIEQFFKVSSKCRKSFTSQAVLIHGKRGLGKTSFLDYAAHKKLAETVIYMNLTKKCYMDLDFTSCVDKLYSVIVKGSCIVHIDEIDKHLDGRIKKKYHDLQYNKNTPSSPAPASKKLEGEVPIVPQPKIPTLEEFTEMEKISFLYSLLNLIETERFPEGVVFIFTCNNFDSIFSGVDMTHFHSIKRRFLNVTFQDCDLEDFRGYCDFYNDSFKDSYPEKYVNSEELDLLFSELDPNIRVPFWHIHQGLLGSSFCIRSTIQFFKDYIPQEDIAFSPSLLVKEDRSNSFVMEEPSVLEEKKEEEPVNEDIEDCDDDEDYRDDDEDYRDDVEECENKSEKVVKIPVKSPEIPAQIHQDQKKYPFLHVDGIKKIAELIPPRTYACSKTVYSEMQELSLSQTITNVLTDEMVELADRVSNYEDGLNGMRVYLSIFENILGIPGRRYALMYFAIKLYQYILSEYVSSTFFDPKNKKLRSTFVIKIKEFSEYEDLRNNPVFQQVSAEIIGRVKNLDGEIQQ